MDYEASLLIKTSMLKAIEIYPLTHKSDFPSQTNDFLNYFFIEFHEPAPGRAVFKRTEGLAPKDTWFLLFEETEKEAISDEYLFYGIRYKTTVKLALKRLENKIEKLEEFATQASTKTKKSRFYIRGTWARRDYTKDMQEALKLFSPEDEINLNFMVAEWPENDMEEKEYVKYFEDKIFRRGKFVNDDIPF